MGVSLTKGQKVSLSKDGAGLTRIFMGLGWDAAKKGGLLGGLFGGGGGDIDLDASCLVFDDAGQPVDQIWFRQLSGVNGAIVHTGDNVTGAGDGDDETIKVDLSRLPASVKSLVFVVNSFRGQTFDKVANAKCRVVDDTSGVELASFTLSEAGSHTGLVMAKIYRHNDEWKIHAIGEKTVGKTFHDMMPAIQGTL
ncbi:TerD family protein [Rhodospirillum rubrum]|uniref:Stress protein n=1 Tax=Rhodospirillum rubrum (strain ATCC 11170 / ATH 1.1.1 / DSM 467 / LMG 4362 / NCIMB 8255 / S1) TaxID=269796 RepID=Q2RW01_RHORT|nr:TerD family protein [Rhodospirillum rubrum]ABC21694.1 stress protein [Rhodospirillum rubrum ATCC 11170]AEO47392.1 stress protein [Rhodospirillum rubrum F11]MBK5953247.1 Tellurium resistance protein terZ [Rhodospirillum rubrum]QXG81356.1 TerD family protein [Rhodospirillum rubrum]HAP99555.1 TerD family protein [Rhodospirillum rubrum]